MSVWLTMPSKRTLAECGPTLEKWRAQGYKIALWRDPGEESPCDLLLTGQYPGYAAAVNALVKAVLAADSKMEFCVATGDDTEPDPNHTASEIAEQCRQHFQMLPQWANRSCEHAQELFGVMQPTGDGHGIETICGSPWLGREFCERAYGGNGPLWKEYFHMFGDQELQEVAIKLGVLWQRPDLTHKHNHWSWTTGKCPDFAVGVNSKEHWQHARSLFIDRRNNGFPGHEPLASGVAA